MPSVRACSNSRQQDMGYTSTKAYNDETADSNMGRRRTWRRNLFLEQQGVVQDIMEGLNNWRPKRAEMVHLRKRIVRMLDGTRYSSYSNSLQTIACLLWD